MGLGCSGRSGDPSPSPGGDSDPRWPVGPHARIWPRPKGELSSRWSCCTSPAASCGIHVWAPGLRGGRWWPLRVGLCRHPSLGLCWTRWRLVVPPRASSLLCSDLVHLPTTPAPQGHTEASRLGPFQLLWRLNLHCIVSSLFQKAKRKSFHKPPPTSPKSPYHSKPRKVASWRALRTPASMPLGSRMSLTPQKLWLGSSKQGFVPGTPVYREKEDMYDEIIELKKSLHTQKSDVDLMRTKLRRLEEENSRKDRQIEQLLEPSRGPEFVRTLAEKRPDAGWVINGLKQRILKLEQQCKEKDNTINKLQTDMKTTNLEEMRIAMETYYEEIHRLQTLLASSETTGKKPPVEKKIGLKRQKKMSSALLSLSRSVQELTEENQSLKEDLDRVLSNSPTVSKIKGYVEWSKPRLLRRIAELEKKISSMESPTCHASEGARSTPPAYSACSSAVQRQPRPDRQEESERLRGAVKSLKGERSALQAQLQERDLEVKQLLQTKADLQRELETMQEGEKERREREEGLREEIRALTEKLRKLEERKKQEADGPVETTPEPQEEPGPPHATASCSQPDAEPGTSAGGSPRPPATCSERRRDAAARVLQSRWKRYQRQKKKAALDEAAVVLQAAFRGHLARVKLLSSRACGSEPPSVPSPPRQDPPRPLVPSPDVQAGGDPGQEEAITIIQSVFRAHLARARHSAAGPRTTTATFTERSAWTLQDEPSAPPFPEASPEPPPPGQPPAGPPPAAEEVNSDDSDEIVLAVPLPAKRSASRPQASARCPGAAMLRQVRLEDK
uniref:IQ domain-containing protein E n=1 Tax=Sus scrofa TaxID=9823 RepID=A0A8D0XZ75_PIG